MAWTIRRRGTRKEWHKDYWRYLTAKRSWAAKQSNSTILEMQEQRLAEQELNRLAKEPGFEYQVHRF